MVKLRLLLLLGLFLFIFVSPVHAAIVINEVSPVTDPEWIELFNTDSSLASLENCVLFLDDDHGIQKISFTGSDTVTNFKVIKKGTYNWTSNWLNNAGDQTSLECPGGQDGLSYGNQSGATIEAPSSDQTIGRNPDGTGPFSLTTSSEGSANTSPSPSPSPSPIPTASPTPTPTPTATATSRPIATPTVKPTMSPTATPKPTAQVLAAKTEVEPDNDVTVAAEIQATATPSATPQPEVKKQGKWPWLMMLGGGGLAITALFPFLRKWYHDPSWLKTLLKGGDRSSFGQE